MAYCRICGKYECKEHSFLLGKRREINEFSGSSPPEVFIGKWNYPNVYVGILSPEEHGDTKVMSSAEEWHARKLGIPSILGLRNKLIYGRTTSNIKKAVFGGKFLSVLQEIAMTQKSVSTEFKLKKPVRKNDERENRVPLIANAGEVERVRLQENVKVEKKVDYLVNDSDVKSRIALLELEKSGIGSSALIKLLSAGLLGMRKNRKLVPTRWSISCVDSTLSENKLEKIKGFSQIDEYLVFSSSYLGNYYEIILLPRYWSFEVVEISMKNFGVWQDYESIFRRKSYADSVTGAYYVNRLAVTEYLEKIKKQASVLVFREIRPEYYSPMGVGILREASREAFKNPPGRFNTLQEALNNIQSRLRIPISYFIKKSQLLKDLQQTSLSSYF